MTTDTDTDVQRITGGPAMLSLDCPDCGKTVQFPVTLAVHKSVDDQHSTLRPKLSAKAADHRCSGDDQPDLFGVDQ